MAGSSVAGLSQGQGPWEEPLVSITTPVTPQANNKTGADATFENPSEGGKSVSPLPHHVFDRENTGIHNPSRERITATDERSRTPTPYDTTTTNKQSLGPIRCGVLVAEFTKRLEGVRTLSDAVKLGQELRQRIIRTVGGCDEEDYDFIMAQLVAKREELELCPMARRVAGRQTAGTTHSAPQSEIDKSE